MKLFKTACIIGTLVVAMGCSPKGKSIPPPGSAPAVDPIAAAQMAVDRAPGFENVTSLGLAYTAKGRNDEALVAFQRAASIAPQSPLAHNNVCSAYNALGKWSKAIEACQKALKIETGFVLAKNNLVYSENSKTLMETHVTEHEKRMKAASGKEAEQIRMDLGMLLYNAGEFDRAVAAWKPISEKSAFYGLAQNDMASCYIVLKKFDLAKAAIAHALEREPKNALYLNNLKWLENAMKE